MRNASIIAIMVITLSLSIVAVGCSFKQQNRVAGENQRVENTSENSEEDGSIELEYGKPVRVTVAINNNIYELLDTDLTSQEIENEIGMVSRQVSPQPEKNGDLARNTLEGPKIIVDGCGKLYKIKGIEITKQIAIEISKGVYIRCRYFCKLK